MKLEQHTVLITGGATGIGWALAQRFLGAGSEVIVVGRRAEVLAAAKKQDPRVHTRVCDVSKASDRVALAAWVTKEFPKLDVLVNNAGVMRPATLREPQDYATDFETNLHAPIHLTALLIPHLLTKSPGTVINTTSGLAYVPLAAAPIYSLTKAALSSFTQSLRHQEPTLDVVELSPPHVNTDLGAPGSNTAGMPLDAFIEAAVQGLVRGDKTVTVGFSQAGHEGSRTERDKLFALVNAQHG